MTATAEKTKETWRDWLPEGMDEPTELFTRDEIIAQTDRVYVHGTEPITAGDLRYWEYIGVLPRGIRKWKDGAPRVFYPTWYGMLAGRVRQLQHAGLSLDEIRPRIRTQARLYLAHGGDSNEPAYPEKDPIDIRLWPSLVDELLRLGRFHEALSGSPTRMIEVHVIAENGRATKYPCAPENYIEQSGDND